MSMLKRHNIINNCAMDPLVPIATTPEPSSRTAAETNRSSANAPDAKEIHLKLLRPITAETTPNTTIAKTMSKSRANMSVCRVRLGVKRMRSSPM